MKNNLSPKVARRRGLSILELTIVIATLLSLLSILFVGARTWKHGSDRATCIMDIRTMQMAVRSYQNMYGYNPGGRPYAENGTQDIVRHLFDKGYIEQRQFDCARGDCPCAGGGTYSTGLPDVFPAEGELFMSCSLAEIDSHRPADHAGW